MSWKCEICGAEHEGLPTCFGVEAPWRIVVPESEFESRVLLSPDECIVDEKLFFIRGHIEIPIRDYSEPLAFSVWSSLSQDSYLHLADRWESSDRAGDRYFGWLSSQLPIYPDTIHLKLDVVSRKPGLTPLFSVQNEDHPLAIDQRKGIDMKRWHEIALELLR